MRDADRGCPPRASPLADQTLRLGRLGGRPGTFDSVCRRVVLDIRGRVRTGVGVGWCFDEARPHARHKRAYESEHLGPGAEPAKHNDSSVRAAFRPVNPVPTRGPAVASPRGSSDWEPSVFETRASPISLCRKRSFGTGGRGGYSRATRSCSTRSWLDSWAPPMHDAVPTASNSAAPAITIDVEERTATTPFAPRRSQPRRRPIVWSRSRRRLRRRLVTPLCGQGPRPAQPAPLGRRLSPPVSHRSRDFHTSCNNAGHRCGG